MKTCCSTTSYGWISQRDHADFVDKMTSRGVDVVELHDLLGPPRVSAAAAVQHPVRRDAIRWIDSGPTPNPLNWLARHDETLLMQAIYRFHPDYTGSKILWGDAEKDWSQAYLEGGDVTPVGNCTVLLAMSERTSRQAITQLAQAMFADGAAERIVVAGMPKLCAAMHLDTVFAFADRDLATIHPAIVDGSIYDFTSTPRDRSPGLVVRDEQDRRFADVVADSLGYKELPGGVRRGLLRLRIPAVGQREQRRRGGTGAGSHL